MCQEYSDATGAALFDRLVFMIRDWEHDDDVGERRNHFDIKKVYQEYMKINNNYVTDFGELSLEVGQICLFYDRRGTGSIMQMGSSTP